MLQFAILSAMRTLALALLCAATSFAAKPTVTSLRLYVMDCGKLKVDDPSRFDFRKDQLKTLDFSVGCYLIVHPKGVVIWDVGAVPDTHFKNDGQPATNFYATATKSLTSQMSAAGYTLADVNYLALSHYHWDHIGNAALFAKSTWLVERIEHDTLYGPTPPERTTPDQYMPLAKSKTVYLPNRDYDIFGDGTVIIKPAYGHTPGHNVLFVKLPKTGPIILSGDLYHYPEEITTGVVPHIDYNKDRTREARKAVDDLMKRTGAKLWVQHDLVQFQTLKKSPEFYE
ncbi:MAG: N-acyl homoserine lactonase family protein [Bryobacteraceae bacterium]